MNGVDVTAYVTSLTSDDNGDNIWATCTINLSSDVQSNTAIGTISDNIKAKDVSFKRGLGSADHTEFSGNVIDWSTNGRVIQLICCDPAYRLSKTVINNDYVETDTFGGDPKLIFQDMCTIAGVTATTSYLQDPAIATVINEYRCNNAVANERSDTLANAIAFRYYWDPYVDSMRWEDIGYEDSTVTLTVGTDILNRPNWTNYGRDSVQQVTVLGSSQQAETVETFTGDGVTTVFTLSQTPLNSVSVTVDSVAKTIGVYGTSIAGTYDFYVDITKKQIIFVTAPDNLSSISVDYFYQIARPVTLFDAAAIANYATDSSGNQYPEQAVVQVTGTMNTSDALQQAQGYLQNQGGIKQNTELHVRGYVGLRRNMRVEIIDPFSGVTTTAYINSIQKNYPFRYDIVRINKQVSTPLSQLSTQDARIKRLEETVSGGSEIIYNVKQFTRKLGLWRREFSKKTRSWSGSYSGFVLDDSRYGVLGTSPLSTTADEPFGIWSTVWLFPGDGVWREYVYDTEYYDSGHSSGVTVDTSAHTITVAGNGNYQTTALAIGPTVNQIKLTVFYTGTILRANLTDTPGAIGSVIFSLPSGVAVTLNLYPSASPLYLNFDAGSSGCVISTPYNAFNIPVGPAIKVEITGYS